MGEAEHESVAGDRVALRILGETATLAYRSATRGRPGHIHVAAGAAGVMLNLCRAYAPPGWSPLRVDLDVARPAAPARFEEAFGAPVRFDAPVAAVTFAAPLLHSPTLRTRPAALTFEDVARARLDPTSRESLTGAVSAQIWTQVLSGAVSLDRAAKGARGEHPHASARAPPRRDRLP